MDDLFKKNKNQDPNFFNDCIVKSIICLNLKKILTLIFEGLEILDSSKDLESLKKEIIILTQLFLFDKNKDQNENNFIKIYSSEEMQKFEQYFKMTSFFSRIMESLINSVLVKWYPIFTKNEKDLVKLWFLNGSAIKTVSSFSNGLFEFQSETKNKIPNFTKILKHQHLKLILELLKLFLGLDLYESPTIWSRIIHELSDFESLAQKTKTWNDTINIISSFPNRIFNILKVNTSLIWTPKVFFYKLTKSLFYFAYNNQISKKHPSFAYVSIWISKMYSIGQMDSVLKLLIEILKTHLNFENDCWLETLNYILQDLTPQCIEKIFVTVLTTQTISLHPNLSKLLNSIFSSLIQNSSSARFLLGKKILLYYQIPSHTVRNIIKFLYEIYFSLDQPEYWTELLTTLADVNSDPQFIKNTPYNQQKIINNALIYILDNKYISKQFLEETGLLTKFMASVQLHLSSPNLKINLIGMKLAESFSVVLDPNQKLDFEISNELNEDYNEEEPAINKELFQDEVFELIKVENQKYLNPDLIFLDILEEQNQIEQNKTEKIEKKTESNLIKKSTLQIQSHKIEQKLNLNRILYDNLDDLSETKTPLYLRDCITNLKSDDPKLIETTLKILDLLINSRPDDLDELSIPLANTLLHTSNNYEITCFETQKHNSLVSLIKYSTGKIVQWLINEFYSPNYSLNDRSQIIDSITDGAKQLSTIDIKNETRLQYNPVKLMQLESNIKSTNQPLNSRDIQNSNLIGTSKRWSTFKKPLISHVNQFSIYSDLFILELLKFKDRSKESYNLLTADTKILGKVVFAFGVFIESGAWLNPQISNLLRSILNFIWILRYYDEPFVRRACILTAQSIVDHIQPWILFEDLNSEFNEIISWIEDSFKNDTDNDVRQLCLRFLISLSKLSQLNPQYQVGINF